MSDRNVASSGGDFRYCTTSMSAPSSAAAESALLEVLHFGLWYTMADPMHATVRRAACDTRALPLRPRLPPTCSAVSSGGLHARPPLEVPSHPAGADRSAHRRR